MTRVPSPASMEAYHERRAGEYDDRYLGRGRFADRDRPGFRTEVADVASTLSSLQPIRTLDVGCGTGFITRHLPGVVVGADRSLGMLRLARSRIVGPTVCADALRLPFPRAARSVASSPGTSTAISPRIGCERSSRRPSASLRSS